MVRLKYIDISRTFLHILSQTAADGTRDMAAMSTMGAGASPMGSAQPDFKKSHSQEKESLELAGSDPNTLWIGDGIEARVLSMYRTQSK